jgi:iron(III) transport system ATP-binding protein
LFDDPLSNLDAKVRDQMRVDIRPREVYARPATRFVAEFIGKANFLKAHILDAETIDVAGVAIPYSSRAKAGEQLTLVLRPEAVRLSDQAGHFRHGDAARLDL